MENIKGELMAIVFIDNETETDEKGNESVVSYLLTLPGQRYKKDGDSGACRRPPVPYKGL